MQSKLLHEHDGQRTFVVVLESGEKVMEALGRFVVAETITAAQLTAIGAFRSAELAYFDWEQKEYQPIPVDEQVEVASMIGDVALAPNGEPALHIHLVLGRRDGSALAGHLSEAEVRPTLEVIVTENPAHLRKQVDRESGLPLISVG